MLSVYAYTHTPPGAEPEALMQEQGEACLRASLASFEGVAAFHLSGNVLCGNASEHCRIFVLRANGESTAYTGACTAALGPGDGVLLCSHGFFAHVTQTEMEVDLLKAADAQAWATLMLLRLAPRCMLTHNVSLLALMMPTDNGRQQ